MSQATGFDLSGKVALVTGASSGFGRRFAVVLARAGAKVGLAARRLDALEELVAEIRAAGGVAAAVRMDVTDCESIEQGVERLTQALGPIDILVNNSGTSITKPVLEQSEQDWDAVVDVNLKGAFFVARAVARRMRDSGRGGNIINIESIMSFRQTGQIAPYAASKAGLTQLTRTLALELARYNIRVNGIAPGYFATEINRELFATAAGAAMIKRIPQRRLGELPDLDGPLLLLASDASRYMTGSTITVDGGHLVSGL
ncbi:MAG TPA: glucose 1-dehydrogenase [Steroidobacter sp.]|nr:glucose 1-dehydrogenase [Steroidobacter sp.]